MRKDCRPHFVDTSGLPVGFRRVEFGQHSIGECFLQEQLHKSPSILPVRELDDSFAPIISLGREILSIDNLFIAPNGRITVVETKMWRNAEATRQVLAQILDYAKRLSALSYEDLERACRSATQPVLGAEDSLYRLVASKFPNAVESEEDFIDAVQKNLRNARFMLLVVGDGIRENLENMLGLLHQQPQMLFTLALVEMHLYECDAIRGRLIIPHLVAHSKEIVRAVVRIENAADAAVTVFWPPETTEKRTTLTETEFIENIKEPRDRELYIRLIAFAKEVGHINCADNSVSARMEFHGTGGLRFFRLRYDRRIVVLHLGEQLLKRGLPDDVAWDLARDLVAIFPAAGLKPDKPEIAHRLSASDVADHFDEFVAAYRKAIDRLKAMTPSEIPSDEKEDSESEEEDEELSI